MAKNTLSFGVDKRLLEIETGGATIGKYTVEGEEQTTSVPSNPENYITIGSDNYLYDNKTGEVTLHPGETIVFTSPGSQSLYLLIGDSVNTRQFKKELTSLEPSFKNDTDYDISFYLGVSYYYTGAENTYRIDAELPYYTDAGRTKVYLKKGETLTMTSSDVVAYLLSEEGEEIATLSNDTPSIIAEDDVLFHIVGKRTDEYSFEIAPCAGEETYTTEYTGDSGILTLRRKEGGKLYFYADAGIGYMQVFETKGKEVMYYLNMDGLDSVKIVSETEVLAAKVSEV